MDREPGLSPYRETLSAAVVDAGRVLLGAPEDVDLAVRSVDPPSDATLGCLRLQVTVPGQPTFLLALQDAEGARGWVLGPHFRAEIPRTEGRPGDLPSLQPLLDALRRRLGAHAQRGGEAWQTLRTAWQTLRPFAEVEDSHFRWLEPSDLGARGMLRLGFRCNQDCSFCWQQRDWPEPPAEWFFRWLDEFAALDLEHLLVSGGEPTTWKRLPELVERAARQHGMRVVLQTNAVGLSSSRMLGRLTGAGLASVAISLHAADAGLSDEMTRAPGTFERTVQGIAACRQAGLPVALTCVVERRNLPSLPAHARFIVDRFVTPFGGAHGLSVGYAHPCASADRAAFAAACPSLDELRAPLSDGTLRLLEAGVSVTADGGCGFPACARPDAAHLLLGRRPQHLREEDSRSRLYGVACEACAIKDRCIGLRREYVEVHGEAGVRPFVEGPLAE